MAKRPGGAMARRPLHFIWLCDCSGSMNSKEKIQQLNFAVREALPHMVKAAESNPDTEVLVRALSFGRSVQWVVSKPTPVADFRWTDLTAEGETPLGAALRAVAEQMKIPPMDERARPPVLVLISDGQPTDDFNAGLRELLALPWGKKAVKVGIAIGRDADHTALQKFIDHPELKPLLANNAETLVKYLRWCSTAVLSSASSPVSQLTPTAGAANAGPPVAQPMPVVPEPVDNIPDVW